MRHLDSIEELSKQFSKGQAAIKELEILRELINYSMEKCPLKDEIVIRINTRGLIASKNFKELVEKYKELINP